MKTADGDRQDALSRPGYHGPKIHLDDVLPFPSAANPSDLARSISVDSSTFSPLAIADQAQQFEIFILFSDDTVCADLTFELRRISSAFVIRSFDTIESFLLYLMRHPMSRGTQRIAVSQLSFSGMSGVDGLAQIRKLEPTLQTLLVGEDPGARTVIQAWRQGAADFLLQPLSIREISQAIVQLTERERPSNQAVLRKVQNPEDLKRIASLTRREVEVFKLVVQGHLNKEMAQILHISLPTIKMHRANLMRKLGLANAAQLVSFYHENMTQIN